MLGFADESVTIALITSDILRLPSLRIFVQPTEANGLRLDSEIMADMLHTVPISKIGKVLGMIDPFTQRKVDEALRLHLGL